MSGGNRCQWEGCGAPCRVKWCADHRQEAAKRLHQAAHQRRRADPQLAERMREQSRSYMRKKRSQWTAADRRAAHIGRRFSKYGITSSWLDATLEEQGGRCAICRADSPGSQRDWHIDHDHVTNVLRGVLCHHCNVGLGHFKDDPDLLHAAIKYLRWHHQQRLIA